MAEVPGPPRFTGDRDANQAAVENYLGDLARSLQEGASGAATSGLPRGHIDGFRLANNTTNASLFIDVKPGVARSDDDAADIKRSSGITKILSARFEAGANKGMLDAGAKAASSWYHQFTIANPSSGDPDFLASLSATAPSLPTGYSKKRRIGALRTDSAGAILPFTQHGNKFLWSTPIQELNGAVTVGAKTLTLTGVPTGIAVEAIIACYINDGTPNSIYFSALSQAALTPSRSGVPGATVVRIDNGADGLGAHMPILTDTAARIRYEVEAAASTVIVWTLGWIDPRGANAD